MRQATVGVRRLIRSDFPLLGLLDSEDGLFHVNGFDFMNDPVLDEKAVGSLAEILGNRVLSTGKPWIGDADDFAEINMQADAKPCRFRVKEKLRRAFSEPGPSPRNSGTK